MITIIDYGMGNLGSIQNMISRLGHKAAISSDISTIESASKIILPGVGAFDTGMHHLKDLGLIEVLNKKALKDKTPILGVCLGMQLVTRGSEEGTLPGLGWIEADTIKFRFNPKETGLKIPHMGWNFINLKNSDPLLKNLTNSKFYFVHSFHVKCDHKEDELATTNYGYEFCSVIRRGNIMATQFHPEKSHKYGMQLYLNFLEL